MNTVKKSNPYSAPLKFVNKVYSDLVIAATAYAAMRLGVKATIVVPSFATAAKLANIEQYGAEIIKVEPRPAAMKEAYDRVVAERDYTLVFPYNQKEIMAGQGTCAVEFVEEGPQMEAMLAPVSGGGLIAGLALGAKHLNPKLKGEHRFSNKTRH